MLRQPLQRMYGMQASDIDIYRKITREKTQTMVRPFDASASNAQASICVQKQEIFDWIPCVTGSYAYYQEQPAQSDAGMDAGVGEGSRCLIPGHACMRG